MTQQDREAEQDELRIRRLTEEEIEMQLDELIAAYTVWEREREWLQAFEEKHRSDVSVEKTFNDINAFYEYNRQRQEYLEEHLKLTRQEEKARERYDQAADVVQVLLPPGTTLIHNYGGSLYSISNIQNNLAIGRQ